MPSTRDHHHNHDSEDPGTAEILTEMLEDAEASGPATLLWPAHERLSHLAHLLRCSSNGLHNLLAHKRRCTSERDRCEAANAYERACRLLGRVEAIDDALADLANELGDGPLPLPPPGSPGARSLVQAAAAQIEEEEVDAARSSLERAWDADELGGDLR